MTIKTTVSATTTIEIPESAFPIYRLQDLTDEQGSFVIYSRTTRDIQGFVTTTIRVAREGCVEVERERSMCLPNSTADYVLGKGEHACTEERFNAACRQASKLVADVCDTASMHEARARSLLKPFIKADSRLDRSLDLIAPYVYWKVTEEKLTLDGDFTPDELEAIAWWMRKYKQPK